MRCVVFIVRFDVADVVIIVMMLVMERRVGADNHSGN